MHECGLWTHETSVCLTDQRGEYQQKQAEMEDPAGLPQRELILLPHLSGPVELQVSRGCHKINAIIDIFVNLSQEKL